MIQEKSRTSEEIALARLRKAEDRLGYDIYLYLRGETPEDWRNLVAVHPSGLDFLGDTKSANHKAMAAALALLLTSTPGAVRYWIDRLTKELVGGEWGQGEPRSNKYSVWSLASVALVYCWIVERGGGEGQTIGGSRADLLTLCRRYYSAWIATTSLGSVRTPAANLVRDRWSGCYASGVGVRSDPGHLEGDARAWVLQTELWTDPVKDRYAENAERRRRQAEGRILAKDAELKRRKQVSESWWRDAILRARKGGLSIEPEIRLAYRAHMENGALSKQIADAVPGSRYAWRFTTYGDGSRVNWLEDSLGERCILGERINPAGSVDVLFPYPEGKGNHRGGTCVAEDGRLVARSASGSDVLHLPPGAPSVHLVWGPDGLKQEAA